MKLKTILAVELIVALTVVSCKKVWDYVKPHPVKPVDKCQVDKIYFKWDKEGTVYSDTLTFTYNSLNNPVTAIFAVTEARPIAQWYCMGFKYDSQNRLSSYLEGALPNLQYGLYWHNLSYVGTTTIIDSIFVYAQADFFNEDRPAESTTEISKFTLDNDGRLIKHENANRNPTVEYYYYDQSGNLILPGVTYSNKTNIRQTNNVWQFITRDYSVNAPAGEAFQYNIKRLPTAAKTFSFLIYPSEMGDLKDQEVKITYDCYLPNQH